MDANLTVIIIFGAALSLALIFIMVAAWMVERRIVEGNRRLDLRVVDVEARLLFLSQAVVPIATSFQAALIKRLTHYHEPRTDELMERLGPPSTLTPEEEAELMDRLDKRSRDMGDLISEDERNAAKILPIVIQMAKAEAEVLRNAPGLFKLVAVTTDARASR
jgi:hypothetical protein